MRERVRERERGRDESLHMSDQYLVHKYSAPRPIDGHTLCLRSNRESILQPKVAYGAREDYEISPLECCTPLVPEWIWI